MMLFTCLDDLVQLMDIVTHHFPVFSIFAFFPSGFVPDGSLPQPFNKVNLLDFEVLVGPDKPIKGELLLYRFLVYYIVCISSAIIKMVYLAG